MAIADWINVNPASGTKGESVSVQIGDNGG